MKNSKLYESKVSCDYGGLNESKYSLDKQLLIDDALERGYKFDELHKDYRKNTGYESMYIDIVEHELLKERSNELE